MGFVVINQERGEFVEMNTTNCKYRITKDSSKCHHFKHKTKALNFLENDTQKILTKEGWEVVSDALLKGLNVSNDKKENISIKKELEPIEEDLSSEDIEKLSKSFEVPNIDIIGTIKQFELFLKKMQDYYEVLSQQHSYIERCKLDFEHKMEFDGKDLSFVKRAELMTNYSTCLEERRRIKNDIDVLEKLLNASIQDLINGTLDKCFDKLENLSYKPRVAPELFEEKERIQVKPCFRMDSSLPKDNLKNEVTQLNESFNFNQSSYLELISGFNPIEDCGE